MTAWHQIMFLSEGFPDGSEERISEKARKAGAARAEVDALKTKLKTHADYDEEFTDGIISRNLYLERLWNKVAASAPNSEHPIVQLPGTWFASRMTRPKNPSENESGSFSACTCYVLHGMLVMIHVMLIVSYIYRWEHNVTLSFTPTNADFWPVVLSASLQAFYTLYTAVLVFLTQRLAMSRALVRRLKLTTIHDISSAWAGLGSALSSVWKQTHISASLSATTAVTTYLVCISVLHVTSSTLLQFQTFNSSITTNVSTTLGWVDVSSTTENPVAITGSLPAISRFPGLVSAGISNNTVYDTLQTSSVVGRATVNATTITSSCGLLPNVTYSRNNNTATAPLGSGNVMVMTASSPWADQIRVLQYGGSPSVNMPAVLLMVSTLLEIEPSVQKEVAVPTIWVCPAVNQTIEVYFMQCSLSTNNTAVVIDMQTNTLENPMPVPQPSTQWEETLQWTSTDWSENWLPKFNNPLSTLGGSGYQFIDQSGYTSEPSIVDEFGPCFHYHATTMPYLWPFILGLNLSAQYLQSSTDWDQPPVSNFTLSPDILEAAIAQTVAQLTWMAGRMNGGIQPGEGMALAYEEVIALRLNITLLPLLFATSASVIMLGLALHTTRAFHASRDSQAPISNAGALQLLWLGYHSPSVQEALQNVEHPTEANLRRAGMIDVCFASTTSGEAELSMRSLIDSQAVDRNDGM
ncbi:hypothetical protein DFJ58DRAFT_848311 [Suillus subalutaceus]|uniref:uncharacterized protein n=1 Tax=Suillus subalutaceus TaxID=48586 RepID=UPI001B869EEB|nr:uncharacterized protein DFJ58DRAFT_848311 [Suillus subalutaceus]KAG1831158.1 hypothetical protein DFJ58DRAFT_848311 [Suillus subalutaceus]